MRIRASFFALLALAVGLAGCRPETVIRGGQRPPKIYKSAVSLSPSATEILGTSLYQINILGRTAQCNYPNPNNAAPVVMNGVKPNYEKIAELRPDVVLYDDLLFSQADIDKFKELGIETFGIHGNNIADFETNLYELASLLHGESTVSEYIDKIEAAIAAAAGSAPEKDLKVAILMPGKGSEHMIAGKGSFVADVVTKAQGKVVGPEGDRFVPLNAESLVAMNPDVIVSAGEGSSLQNDPRLQSITAIKKKHIVPTDPDVLLRRGGRVDKLIRGLNNYFYGTAQEG